MRPGIVSNWLDALWLVVCFCCRQQAPLAALLRTPAREALRTVIPPSEITEVFCLVR